MATITQHFDLSQLLFVAMNLIYFSTGYYPMTSSYCTHHFVAVAVYNWTDNCLGLHGFDLWMNLEQIFSWEFGVARYLV